MCKQICVNVVVIAVIIVVFPYIVYFFFKGKIQFYLDFLIREMWISLVERLLNSILQYLNLVDINSICLVQKLEHLVRLFAHGHTLITFELSLTDYFALLSTESKILKHVEQENRIKSNHNKEKWKRMHSLDLKSFQMVCSQSHETFEPKEKKRWKIERHIDDAIKKRRKSE